MIVWKEYVKQWAARCPFPECLDKPDLTIAVMGDYTTACDELVRLGWRVKYYESIAVCPKHKNHPSLDRRRTK